MAIQKQKSNNRFYRVKFGEVISPSVNFNMPFKWNRESEFDWSEKESLLKEIEVSSMWRDYFTAKADKKHANESYWKAHALKEKIKSKQFVWKQKEEEFLQAELEYNLSKYKRVINHNNNK